MFSGPFKALKLLGISKVLFEPVPGVMASIAHFITGHELTNLNRIFYFRLLSKRQNVQNILKVLVEGSYI